MRDRAVQTLRRSFLLACFVLPTAVVHAQGDPPNKLPALKRLKCQFSTSAAGAWQNGEVQARVKSAGMLSFEIDSIDTDDGSARFVGLSSEPAHIIAQLRGWTLHFMDARPDGSLYITTVFSQESRPRTLKAVYTRTSYLPVSIPGFAAEPEASQYYGQCEVIN